MPEFAVGLMAKFPEWGKVKTRLAVDLGKDRALDIYNSLLERAAGIVTSLDSSIYHRCACVAPPEKMDDFRKLYGGFDCYIEQHGDDLGQRMQRALEYLLGINGIKAACLIGADIPGISHELIATCKEQVESHDLIVGPTNDGGYYLTGMKRLFPALFEGPVWGTERVLLATLEIAYSQELTVAKLPPLRDLDTFNDLRYFEEYRKFLIKK